MKSRTWKTYTFWIIITETVGALSGWLTKDGAELYNATINKPFLSPPSIVFPIVWAILFALMGVGITRVYTAPISQPRSHSLQIFFIQLAFNFFWSIIFFHYQKFGFAFFWVMILWILIWVMIFSFRKVDKLSSWLQIPYLIWVTFAAYLNFGVWILNR